MICLNAFPQLLEAEKRNKKSLQSTENHPGCSAIGFIAYEGGEVEVVPFYFNNEAEKERFIDVCKLSYRGGDAVDYCFIAKNWLPEEYADDLLFIEYKGVGDSKALLYRESIKKILSSSEKIDDLFNYMVGFHLSPKGPIHEPFVARALHIDVSKLLELSIVS